VVGGGGPGVADRRGGAMSPAGKRGRFRLAGKGPARDDFEPPKYIQQLIASINDGAKSAQLGALAFVAIGLFLLATSFSATDEDLLMGKSIAISQLGGVAVPVALSFGFMPAVFVAVHLYTLIRFEMLAGNVRQLMQELAEHVALEADRARCRQLLANVEFVHALATRGATWVYRWTAWGIIAVFPIFVLLLVQLGSLRLQDHVVNIIHHVAIFADLVLLQWFTLRLRGARMPAGVDGWFMRRGLHRAIAMVPVLRRERLLWLPLAVLVADLCWCRVPSAAATTVGDGKTVFSVAAPRMSPRVDETWFGYIAAAIADPWVHPVDLILCPYVKLGCRYLSVPGRTLVAKVWDNTAFVELRAGQELDERRKASFDKIVLRDRMLRFANLSNSLMFMADLTDAQMAGASLYRARLQGATLDRASLQGARLDWASLQGARLIQASLQGATLDEASLQGATFHLASLQGASLSRVSLQGAWLHGSMLPGAYLAGASLQGANLDTASLHSANFDGASLQGATLDGALMQGAYIGGASLQGASLRGSKLWNVQTDEATDLSWADLRRASFEPMSLDERDGLLQSLPEDRRADVARRLNARLDSHIVNVIKSSAKPTLVSAVTDEAWATLSESQVTQSPHRIADPLAQVLADDVASIHARSAVRVASRLKQISLDAAAQGLLTNDVLSQALRIPLGCRLLDHVASKRVTLPDDSVKDIRDLVGTCPAPAPPAQ